MKDMWHKMAGISGRLQNYAWPEHGKQHQKSFQLGDKSPGGNRDLHAVEGNVAVIETTKSFSKKQE